MCSRSKGGSIGRLRERCARRVGGQRVAGGFLNAGLMPLLTSRYPLFS
jgi:hypothetical protein